MPKAIHSYPKVYNLGHPALEGLLDGEVVVEEKVDGSQLSARVCPESGCLQVRSKNAVIDSDGPPALFDRGVETLRRLHAAGMLESSATHRFEYLRKPKHNALAYDRVPLGHLALLDVDRGTEDYFGRDDKAYAARQLGLEVVPVLFKGHLSDFSTLEAMLERDSFLGGTKIEGVVIKNYARFGRDGKALMGKHVSERFREIHGKEWKKANPQGKDVLEGLVERYKTEGRWAKAVHHLFDDGALEHSPRDIGPLMREVVRDVEEECGEEIRDILFKWAWRTVGRRLAHGLPEWYKERLAKAQFKGDS